MKMTQPLMALALGAMLTFACSKDNAPKAPKLSVMKLADDGDGGSSDLTGYAACHATYVNTINNPPEGYIPGDAEIAFGQCEDALIQTHPDENLQPIWFPPTNIIHAPGPPAGSSGITDNVRCDNFFGLSIVWANNSADQIQAATDLFARYSNMICDAVSEFQTANPGVALAYYQKPDICTQYTAIHPDLFTSDDDKQLFIKFAVMIFTNEHFVIGFGPHAIPTVVSPFSAGYNSCIDLQESLEL
jgi:hypothetical protein